MLNRAAILRAFLAFTGSIFLLSAPLAAQVQDSILSDTIWLRRGTALTFPDTSIILRRDTLLLPGAKAPLKARRGLFSRLFYNYIYVEPAEQQEGAYRGVQGQDGRNAPCIGKTVGDIHVTSLAPFRTNIYDTAAAPVGRLAKAANFLHINTRDWAIRNILLFRPGDTLSPLLISDSERLLREQEFIKDARIYPIYRSTTSDTVDLAVIEKDVWSLIVKLRTPDTRSGEIYLDERNFLGTGLRVGQRFKISPGRPFGYQGRIIHPNILSSYIRAEAEYTSLENLKYRSTRVERQFITPDIRQGGGFRFRRIETLDTLYPGRPEIEVHSIKFDDLYAWLGYNFPAYCPTFSGCRTGIVPAIGYKRTHYFRRPSDEQEPLLYEDAQTLFASLSFSSRQYYTDNLVFGFGRTEDIPTGLRVELTGGYQFGEFGNRSYGSASITFAGYLDSFGYASGTASAGGYLSKTATEEGLLEWRIQFISKLLDGERRYQLRHYLYMEAVRGINRKPNEARRIDGAFGIRGLASDSLIGQSTAVASYTALLFSPWQPLGFRIALLGFFDIGYVGPEGRSVFSNRPYTGFGVGLQANNENLIFGNINLRLGLYPTPPAAASPLSISLTLDQPVHFESLAPRPPGVLPYTSF